MSARGFFVTGTDTGVGKTVATCALVRALRQTGIDAVAMKAVETGVGPEGPLDAIALREASDCVDELDEVCPLRFELPAAPVVAAAHEGRNVDLEILRAAFWKLAGRHAAVLLEGAGGLLVPLRPDFTMADLASELGLPIVVVTRAALGTINHTLLSLEALRARDLDLAGVVISHADGAISSADEANLDCLRRELGERLVGEIPPLPAGGLPQVDCLRLEPLLARLS